MDNKEYGGIVPEGELKPLLPISGIGFKDGKVKLLAFYLNPQTKELMEIIFARQLEIFELSYLSWDDVKNGVPTPKHDYLIAYTASGVISFKSPYGSFSITEEMLKYCEPATLKSVIIELINKKQA